jgi:hypothetical protein
VEQKIPGGLSAEDWTLLQQVSDLIRGAIPPGSNSPPAKVFGVIETALCPTRTFCATDRALIDLRLNSDCPCMDHRDTTLCFRAGAAARADSARVLADAAAFGAGHGFWKP